MSAAAAASGTGVGRDRARRWGWALAVVLVLLHAGWVGQKRNDGDLRVYYDTVARLPAGLDLYQAREGPDPQRPTGFIYPLPFALAFAPLTTLPFRVVRVGWAAIMGLLALRAYALALSLAFPEGVSSWADGGRRAARLAVVAVGVAVSLRFVLSDLQHGQANILVVWLALEGVAAVARERARAGGAFLAAATLIKLTPALLVAGELVGGRRRVVAWAAAVGAALAVAPALVLGPSATLDATWRFVAEVTPWNARFHAWVGNNASLVGLVHRLVVGEADAGQPPVPMLLALDPAIGRAAGMLVSALAFGLALAGTRRLGGVARAAVLLAATPLVSPIAWKPHLVALILPATLAARVVAEPGGALTRGALALGATCLLLGREVVGREVDDAATRWGVPTLGIVLLAVGLQVAAQRAATDARQAEGASGGGFAR